ncbi:hypothetical protein [Streptomyces sp. TRM68367]|nr:hypothetical protein [Streptomyces sp. TRM68367]
MADWHRFDVSTAELICRVFADREFGPVSVAAKVECPFLHAC